MRDHKVQIMYISNPVQAPETEHAIVPDTPDFTGQVRRSHFRFSIVPAGSRTPNFREVNGFRSIMIMVSFIAFSHHLTGVYLSYL